MLAINGLGGADTINAGALAIAGRVGLTLNGGLGDDTLTGSASNDVVNGGDGADNALLGAGNDVFVWNPGDDNDTIDGQASADTLAFNGSAAPESVNLSAVNGHARLFRDVANVIYGPRRHGKGSR